MYRRFEPARRLLIVGMAICLSGPVPWPRLVFAQAPSSGAVRLAPVQQLRKGVDLWPLISAPISAPQQRINTTLARLNQRLVRAVRRCDLGYTSALKQLGPEAKGQQPVAEDWDRTVEVTMSGPHFLSLVASEEADCGGMYPNSDQMALVFDINTGLEVDWTSMVASSSHPSAYADAVDDGSMLGALVLPALRKLAIAQAAKECRDVFDAGQSFLIWPDARHQTIVAWPFDLAHVIQACGNPVDLSLDQARKLGFREDLLDALQQAHSR